MTIENTIKIFVTYKDKHKILKSDIITPIQTGRAIADEIFEEMIGDDTGDNISSFNNKYNELSAQYWVWKNYDKIGNPKYIGFMHYRRHFLFNTKKRLPLKKWLPRSKWFLFKKIDNNYLKFLNDEDIKKSIDGYDCIVPYIYDYKNYRHKSVIEDFKNLPGQNIEHLYLMIDTVKKFFPDYAQTADDVKNGHNKHIANMFIMTKQMFNEYCEFLFTIEKHIEQRIDATKMNKHEIRFLGYLGEIILTIFILQKRKENKYKIKELNTSFIKHTPYEQISNRPQITKSEECFNYTSFKPAFTKNFSAIAMSSSNEYVPYLSTCLQSLKEHTSSDHNYDILVFERSITDENKTKLKEQIEEKNISLRFINPMNIISQYNLKFPPQYNLECYFRLTSPLILNDYKKLVFTDVDLVFQKDIKDLYNVEVRNALGACQDLVWCAFLDAPRSSWLKYSKKVLNLKNPYKYFNTGVMVLNLDYLRENQIPQKLLSMANERMYKILEQDVLNKYFQDNITYLDDIWNLPTLNKKQRKRIEKAQKEYKDRYNIARENAAIIHWAGDGKAWNNKEEDLSLIWWEYAERSPYCEKITTLLNEYNAKKEYVKKNYKKIYSQYIFYKTISKISIGYLKKYSKDKTISLKKLLRHK